MGVTFKTGMGMGKPKKVRQYRLNNTNKKGGFK
jgi:hypothetical protein